MLASGGAGATGGVVEWEKAATAELCQVLLREAIHSRPSIIDGGVVGCQEHGY